MLHVRMHYKRILYGIAVCITNAGNRGNVMYLIIYSSVMWQLNCYFKQHFNLTFVYRNNKRLCFPVTSAFPLSESPLRARRILSWKYDRRATVTRYCKHSIVELFSLPS